jgi:hypothetical protein
VSGAAEDRVRADPNAHVLAAARDLNRLERVGETHRAALNAPATVAPGWLRQQAPPEWFDRYVKRVEETRLPRGQEARYAHAEVIDANRNSLYTAWNAMANLADLAGKVIVTVRAESPKGFDNSKLQNGVWEPLREADLID